MYDIKEIAKNNRYIKDAKIIKDIGIKENCDVGVALDIYCVDNNIKYTPKEDKQKEFLDICRDMTLNKIIEELDS